MVQTKILNIYVHLKKDHYNSLRNVWVTLRLSPLEAFSVDNGWTRFVVFLFADPHLLEGGERSQD